MTVLDIVDSCAYVTMSRNSKAYDQEFKENVINYVLEHPEEKYTALEINSVFILQQLVVG